MRCNESHFRGQWIHRLSPVDPALDLTIMLLWGYFHHITESVSSLIHQFTTSGGAVTTILTTYCLILLWVIFTEVLIHQSYFYVWHGIHKTVGIGILANNADFRWCSCFANVLRAYARPIMYFGGVLHIDASSQDIYTLDLYMTIN